MSKDKTGDGDHKQKRQSSDPFDLGGILGSIQQGLEEAGIGVDLSGDCTTWSWPKNSKRVKVVCVTPGLKDSVDEMGKSPRDQVVMVRVDTETSEALDAWVQTGAVKSRSEAAALFIREGLRCAPTNWTGSRAPSTTSRRRASAFVSRPATCSAKRRTPRQERANRPATERPVISAPRRRPATPNCASRFAATTLWRWSRRCARSCASPAPGTETSPASPIRPWAHGDARHVLEVAEEWVGAVEAS